MSECRDYLELKNIQHSAIIHFRLIFPIQKRIYCLKRFSHKKQ